MENNNATTEAISTSIPIIISGQNEQKEILKDSQNLKKNTRDMPLMRTILVKSKLETHSLDDLGNHELAMKHRYANKPLKVLGDLSEDDVNFCHCCDLPCEKKGIVEPFEMCDDTDLFANVVLAFHYIIFFLNLLLLLLF